MTDDPIFVTHNSAFDFGDEGPPDPLAAWQEIAALPMASPDTLELAQRIAEAQQGVPGGGTA